MQNYSWEQIDENHIKVTRGKQSVMVRCENLTQQQIQTVVAMAGELSSIFVLKSTLDIQFPLPKYGVEAAVALKKGGVPDDAALVSGLQAMEETYAYGFGVEKIDFNHILDAVKETGCAIEIDDSTGRGTLGIFIALAITYGMDETKILFRRFGSTLDDQIRMFRQVYLVTTNSFSSFTTLSDRGFNTAMTILFHTRNTDDHDLIVDLCTKADNLYKNGVDVWGTIDQLVEKDPSGIRPYVKLNKNLLDASIRAHPDCVNFLENAYSSNVFLAYVTALTVTLFTPEAIESAIDLVARSYGSNYDSRHIAAVLLYAEGDNVSEYDLVALPAYRLDRIIEASNDIF